MFAVKVIGSAVRLFRAGRQLRELPMSVEGRTDQVSGKAIF
jgi:hypothetical protein